MRNTQVAIQRVGYFKYLLLSESWEMNQISGALILRIYMCCPFISWTDTILLFVLKCVGSSKTLQTSHFLYLRTLRTHDGHENLRSTATTVPGLTSKSCGLGKCREGKTGVMACTAELMAPHTPVEVVIYSLLKHLLATCDCA